MYFKKGLYINGSYQEESFCFECFKVFISNDFYSQERFNIGNHEISKFQLQSASRVYVYGYGTFEEQSQFRNVNRSYYDSKDHDKFAAKEVEFLKSLKCDIQTMSASQYFKMRSFLKEFASPDEIKLYKQFVLKNYKCLFDLFSKLGFSIIKTKNYLSSNCVCFGVSDTQFMQCVTEYYEFLTGLSWNNFIYQKRLEKATTKNYYSKLLEICNSKTEEEQDSILKQYCIDELISIRSSIGNFVTFLLRNNKVNAHQSVLLQGRLNKILTDYIAHLREVEKKQVFDAVKQKTIDEAHNVVTLYLNSKINSPLEFCEIFNIDKCLFRRYTILMHLHYPELYNAYKQQSKKIDLGTNDYTPQIFLPEY